jgi:hypothetical protein
MMLGTRLTLILGGVALLLGVLLLATCQGWRSAGATAALNRDAAGAAIASGQDAVTTVGAVGASEAVTDAIGRKNDADIRKAEGADVAVSAAVDTAGRSALCMRSAYRSDPRCLRKPAP